MHCLSRCRTHFVKSLSICKQGDLNPRHTHSTEGKVSDNKPSCGPISFMSDQSYLSSDKSRSLQRDCFVNCGDYMFGPELFTVDGDGRGTSHKLNYQCLVICNEMIDKDLIHVVHLIRMMLEHVPIYRITFILIIIKMYRNLL